MTTYFQPKADIPEWRMVFAALDDLDVGDLLSFEALDEALGRSFLTNRSPFYRARTELERERQRTLVAVPTKGYRIIEASEHEVVAVGHHRRGRRAINRAVQIVRAADPRRLSPEQQQRMDGYALVLSAHHRAIGHIDQRVKQLEKARTQDTAVRTEHAVALKRIEDALERHGIQVEEA